jgi:hypothetical protein
MALVRLDLSGFLGNFTGNFGGNSARLKPSYALTGTKENARFMVKYHGQILSIVYPTWQDMPWQRPKGEGERV